MGKLIKNPAERLIVVDVETFGLVHAADPIIEVGLAMVDAKTFKIVETVERLVWTIAHERRHKEKIESNDKFYQDVHIKGGLILDASTNGWSRGDVDADLADLLVNEWGVTGDDPMVGSSVQFDREALNTWLPKVAKTFHYRNLDVSSIKEACRRFNPELFKKAEEDKQARGLHRVKPDVEDTVAELKWYADNFLFIPGGDRD